MAAAGTKDTKSSSLDSLSPFTREKHLRAVKQARYIAHMMDSLITIPILNITIGIDGLLGLIPIVGDLLCALAAIPLFMSAKALALDPHVMDRMARNLVVDFVVGSIPIVGDMFDICFKAHTKNKNLLERAILEKERQIQLDASSRCLSSLEAKRASMTTVASLAQPLAANDSLRDSYSLESTNTTAPASSRGRSSSVTVSGVREVRVNLHAEEELVPSYEYQSIQMLYYKQQYPHLMANQASRRPTA
eukprot:GILJ01008584.1.p1 GENE.GILJ01008584.1~~GILJ01008584.1.p1  ORF type:complete len:248 (+),score=23.76 GILJ01008584.1:74-817(+)